MDYDVELSMQQAHQKWIAKVIALVALSFIGMIGFLGRDCNKVEAAKVCVDTVINPSYNKNIECPNPMQTLTFPPGWTWAKCTCPDRRSPP
jgi:hypothetical protein